MVETLQVFSSVELLGAAVVRTRRGVKMLAGLVMVLLVIVLGIVIIYNFTTVQQKPAAGLSSQASSQAYQTMLHEFNVQTGAHADIVYYSGMVTHRLLGAETVQILADNHKVYSVQVNRNGTILSVHASTWP